MSATNIVRLKKGWEQEYKDRAIRDLREKEYVYLWADGVYFNIRLEDERSCILVIMGCNLFEGQEVEDSSKACHRRSLLGILGCPGQGVP